MSTKESQNKVDQDSLESLRSTRRRDLRRTITFFLLGTFCLMLAILSLQCDFLELSLIERTKVRPGLPPYEKWRDPSGVDFGVRVFLFAVENPDEFLANNQTKLKLKEIGPIYYKKTVSQEDIVFHKEDSTLSYTTVSGVEFIPEMNEPGILNKSIILINPVLFGLAAMVHENFIAKVAFDLAAKEDHVFINRTVYEVLWEATSPMLELVKKIPFAVPRANAGVMFNSFFPQKMRYNVNIGTRHGFKDFFKINTLNGISRINVYEANYPKHCPFSLKGASEGTGLPPRLTKDTVINAYTNNLCRTYPMVYNRTVKVGIIDAYEFIFASDIYKRTEDPSKDCFRRTGSVILPDGLIDSSRCAFGTPLALSNPHFYQFPGEWDKYLDGLTPNLKDHASYFLAEPVSGIQLEAVARIQSNIPLPSLDFYPPNIRRFSEMVLPQFWMEYNVYNNDPLIITMILLITYMPVIQQVVIVLLFILSACALYKAVKIATTLKLGKRWNRSKEQKTIYPTTCERYFASCNDDLERTAL